MRSLCEIRFSIIAFQCVVQCAVRQKTFPMLSSKQFNFAEGYG